MTSSPLVPSPSTLLLRNDPWPLDCICVYFFRTALGKYGGDDPHWARNFRIRRAESQGIGPEGPTGPLSGRETEVLGPGFLLWEMGRQRPALRPWLGGQEAMREKVLCKRIVTAGEGSSFQAGSHRRGSPCSHLPDPHLPAPLSGMLPDPTCHVGCLRPRAGLFLWQDPNVF